MNSCRPGNKISKQLWVLSMDKVILSVNKRVLIAAVCSLAILSWLALCKAYYNSYWQGTIYRVQTVDFNILHHTAPQTLSRLVISGRDDLVQQVLDSTYGLFGLVVTDASGKSVLFRTSKTYHRPSWQKLVSPAYLDRITEPYDLLTDPPPQDPVYAHESPRKTAAVKTGPSPGGNVLGRLYYVRSVPPVFWSDLAGFLTGNWFEMSGSKRGYLFISVSTLSFSLAVLLLVLLRRRGLEMKVKEVEHAERELEIRSKALEHLKAELTAQKARKEWLEKEADQSYRCSLRLKDALVKLRDSLKAPDGKSMEGQTKADIPNIRLPLHPPSTLLAEIESLVPDLTDNAQALKTRAGELNEYCASLEDKQEEMKKILDLVSKRAEQALNAARPISGESNKKAGT